MEYTAETIKEVAQKAIEMLKDAPLSDNGYKIKIFINENKQLSYCVIQGNFIPFHGCQVLAQISYEHPCYDSDSVMNANGVELTEENFRSWDWGNFTESNDFSNAVENLEYQINQGIIELRQKEDLV